MKTLTTISLFIFGIILTALLTAGLVFYQNNKTGNNVAGNQTGNLVQGTVSKLTSGGKSITLNMTEIAKHNKASNCWMLISGNVYDITPFFGSHPGGNATMEATCGTNATDAYMTKDPNATSTNSGSNHSSNARNMLKDYYLGKFNENIGSNTVSQNNNSTSTTTSQSSAPNTVKNNTVKPVVAPVGEITLTLSEIAKHNKSSDCFMLISGKVYNITPFFGSHPGGNATMAATCGTDSTAAYYTKDPYATSSYSSSAHSSNAQSMLASYYIGNLNQTIGQQAVQQTNSVVAPTSRRGEDNDD
jgi:cytochrome b involved in lipid metabolism